MENNQQNAPTQVASGTDNSPQVADEYSTPIPQGATSSLGDEYSTPIPEGATSAPQAPQVPEKTGLQRAEEAVTGANETDPNWKAPATGGMISGAMKSAATGLGGILDLITKPQESLTSGMNLNPKELADGYKKANPGASQQQVAAFVNNIINNPHQAPPKVLQEISTWLHQGQQPNGLWENIGALGEQALEWIGGEGLLKLTTAPAKAVQAGQAVTQVADTAAHMKQAGQVASFLKANPKIAGLLTVGLKAAKDALGVGAQNYMHNEDVGEAVKAGAFGGAVAAPIHALGEVAGSVANSAEEMLPKNVETNIPTQRLNPEGVVKDTIPVSAAHPEAPEPTTATGKFLQGAATKKGAFDFTEGRVQPAATKAANDNFADVAKNAVDDLHDAQGVEDAPAHPTLNTVDEAAKYMQGEAKKTYSKLDEAAQPDVDAWEAQYGKGVPKGTPNAAVLGPDGQPVVGDHYVNPITAEGEPIPDKPKLFTELQDQINGAKDTIGNPGESQVDKQKAIQDLPKFEQEMKDFLAKHSDIVDQGELDTANQVYAKSKRFEWVADKVRQATRGAGQGSIFKGDIQSLSPKSLESLPRQYDTRFGEGSFLDLLGTKGYRNYNDVVNAMKNPKTGSMFFEWLKSVPLGFGKVLGSIPAGALADKILFDPVVGERIVNGFKKFADNAAAAAKAPGVAASATGAFNKPKAQNAYAGISSDLGGK